MVPESKVAHGDRAGDSAEPGEPLALREIDKFLAKSEYANAVLAAFPLVMIDVQRAFGTTFPPHWTGRDVLAHGLRRDSGNLPSLLYSLYRLYEPVRFGRESDWTPGELREIVRRIYAETAVGRRRAPSPAPSAGPTVWDTGRSTQPSPPPKEGPSW